MNETRITWRQIDESRWTARDSDGYSFRVEESHGDWAWSLWVPGKGQAAARGTRATREDAIAAVERAFGWQRTMYRGRRRIRDILRFQFGLRWLFVATALAAVFLSTAAAAVPKGST